MQNDNKKKFIINFVYFALILFIAFIVLKYGIGLIAPFIIAFLVAYLVRKPAKFITSKIKIPYKILAVIFVLIVYILVGILIFIVGLKLFSTIVNLVSKLPNLYYTRLLPVLELGFNNIENLILQVDPTYLESVNDIFNQIVRSIGQSISSVSMKVVSFLTGKASSIPALFLSVIITLISTFFIAIDYDRLMNFVAKQLRGKTKEILFSVKDYLVNTLFVVIGSYILIMSMTFIEMLIGLSLIGVENVVIVALIVAVVDIFPVVGTGTVMIPWAIITAIQGDFGKAIALLILYLIITVVRNIVEPKFIGKQMGLHPVVSIMSMFIGAKLFGTIGLFGLPVTISFLMHLSRNKTINFLKLDE